MLQMRGADKRLYNPDRDLIWAMPRLIHNALHMLGQDITTDHIRGMMIDRCIDCHVPDERLREELESFIKDLARFLNALREDPVVRREPEGWFRDLFEDGPRAGVRALISELLMCAMFSEMPIWFESVQPEKEGQTPSLEDVQSEVDRILRCLGRAGSSDE